MFQGWQRPLLTQDLGSTGHHAQIVGKVEAIKTCNQQLVTMGVQLLFAAVCMLPAVGHERQKQH